MVDLNKINQGFQQQADSCVLAGYAVVTNYFRNHITIPEIFNAYCDFFKIPYISVQDSERSSGNHLNFICSNILKWRGYQMIDYLHNHSYNHLFNTNKQFFSAWIYSLEPLTTHQYDGLIEYLNRNEALANFTTQQNGLFHSQTCGINETGIFFIHNSAGNANPKIELNAVLNHSNIQECIVYNRL